MFDFRRLWLLILIALALTHKSLAGTKDIPLTLKEYPQNHGLTPLSVFSWKHLNYGKCASITPDSIQRQIVSDFNGDGILDCIGFFIANRNHSLEYSPSVERNQFLIAIYSSDSGYQNKILQQFGYNKDSLFAGIELLQPQKMTLDWPIYSNEFKLDLVNPAIRIISPIGSHIEYWENNSWRKAIERWCFRPGYLIIPEVDEKDSAIRSQIWHHSPDKSFWQKDSNFESVSP